MEVTLKYFAWVRERVGIAEEKVLLPQSVATVADTIAWLKRRGDNYASAFERTEVIRAAVDRTHAALGASVVGSREIAFFPPITGG